MFKNNRKSFYIQVIDSKQKAIDDYYNRREIEKYRNNTKEFSELKYENQQLIFEQELERISDKLKEIIKKF